MRKLGGARPGGDAGTTAHTAEEVFEATMRQQQQDRRIVPEDVAGLITSPAGDEAVAVTGKAMVCDGAGVTH